ncbi:MAG TPA: hypothetical protein VFM94_01085 [Solirubrobacterales bacterium]|nr:hypothetical protein [Solirubrobacterales bacterium]
MRANLSWEPQRRRVALLSLLPALLIMAWLSFAPSNASAAPAELWTECLPGSGAGQCSNPRGIAANPENGRLYVADQGNGRVLELDALGNFIKAWGWGVDTGAAALEVCTPGSGCQAAPFGSNTGQLSALPMGVAVDSAGNVYVEDRGLLGNPSVRVQKYGSDGSFILMFGGGVNKTKVQEGGKVDSEENLCPFDPGDECQAGTIGNGQGQFGSWEIGSHIAIDSKGTATDADDDV